MIHRVFDTACSLAFFLAVFLVLMGQPAPVAGQDAEPSADAQRRTAGEMTERIDQLLAERWVAEEVTPASRSSDAEFLRRIYLDLTGTIPTVQQARRFLTDETVGKREKLIDDLLASPQHATHMSITWRNRLLPANFDPAQLNQAAGLQSWLRRQFLSNRRYDHLVRDFLVATGAGDRGPGIFYTALELKPEKLAASTSRIFMGIQIQCAECHDHPHDDWSHIEFWEYAAFFARLNQPERTPLAPSDLVDIDEGEVTFPETGEVVPPRYPKGDVVDPQELGTRRDQLAIWMVSPRNPYMPRAAVNWAWAHLFGRGIVNPVDDFSELNLPSHPELLDELTTYFVRSGYDMRGLFRVLTTTRAYQLSSAGGSSSEESPLLFERMATKVLTPEQLYDSLNRVLWRPQIGNDAMAGGPLSDPRRLEFISRMETERSDATLYEYGLPQAFVLINGPEINQVADFERSRILKALSAPFFDDDQRVDTLFLAALTRFPNESEKQLCKDSLGQVNSVEERQQVLGDILWALLNGAEFAVNH